MTVTRTDWLFGAARLILRDDGHAAGAVQDALLHAWLPANFLSTENRFAV